MHSALYEFKRSADQPIFHKRNKENMQGLVKISALTMSAGV